MTHSRSCRTCLLVARMGYSDGAEAFLLTARKCHRHECSRWRRQLGIGGNFGFDGEACRLDLCLGNALWSIQ